MRVFPWAILVACERLSPNTREASGQMQAGPLLKEAENSAAAASIAGAADPSATKNRRFIGFFRMARGLLIHRRGSLAA